MTFSLKFSMSRHVIDLIYPTAPSHFLPCEPYDGTVNRQMPYKSYSIVINKLSYASPTWTGFAESADFIHQRLLYRPKFYYYMNRNKILFYCTYLLPSLVLA